MSSERQERSLRRDNFQPDGQLSSRGELPHKHVVADSDGEEVLVECESVFRIISPWGDGVMLYDLATKIPRIAHYGTTTDASSQASNTLRNCGGGNVVHARLRRTPSQLKFRFTAVERLTETTLTFVKDPITLPGDATTVWQNKSPEKEFVTQEDTAPDGTPRAEMHLHQNYLGMFAPDPDSDPIDIYFWEHSRKGAVPLEDIFEETPAFEDGAQHVLVAKSTDQPFVAVYIFPEGRADHRDTLLRQMGYRPAEVTL